MDEWLASRKAGDISNYKIAWSQSDKIVCKMPSVSFLVSEKALEIGSWGEFGNVRPIASHKAEQTLFKKF